MVVGIRLLYVNIQSVHICVLGLLRMDPNELGGVSLIKLSFWSSTGCEIEKP